MYEFKTYTGVFYERTIAEYEDIIVVYNNVVYTKDLLKVIGYYQFTGTSALPLSTVYEIAPNAFGKCVNLQEIIIPDSVTSICDLSFHKCTSLEEIALPNSVISLGDYTFRGCSKLKEIKISNSVTSIGKKVFHNCTSLKEVVIPDSVTSIGEEVLGVAIILKG